MPRYYKLITIEIPIGLGLIVIIYSFDLYCTLIAKAYYNHIKSNRRLNNKNEFDDRRDTNHKDDEYAY
jgi:hypothetical protein